MSPTPRKRRRRSLRRMPVQTAMLFLLGVLAPLLAAEHGQVDTVEVQTSAAWERTFNGYFASLAASSEPNEVALSLQLPFGNEPSPSEIENRIDRWERHQPNAEAVRLLAALSCSAYSEHNESALQRMCTKHKLLPRWQQIDRGNALPWMIAAQRAQSAGEDADLARALTKVEESDRFDWQQRVIMRVIHRGLADLPAVTFESADHRAVAGQGIVIGIQPITWGAINAVCPIGKSAPVRPERAAICLHLSALLTAETSEIGDVSYGHVIATAYSDHPQTAKKRDVWALQFQRFMDQVETVSDSASVPAGYADYIDQVIAEGEVLAMRAWLEAGKD